jgi:ergothioneine biosynthesis protein EgtB
MGITALHEKKSRLAETPRLDYQSVRQYSLALCETLSEEDCCAQSIPDASPIKWHLAHSTWFFETFILAQHEPHFAPFHPAFRMLFNSYYNGIGDRHARPQRGLLTRPSLAEVLAYRRAVDERMLALLAQNPGSEALTGLIELGLQHEQQHQELMLTDVKHLLWMNPLRPAMIAPQAESLKEKLTVPAALEWLRFDAGMVTVGHAGDGFCFDNELPRHRQFVEAFTLATRLTTNADYALFIGEGGYRNPALWLSEGWDWVRANGIAHPLYWEVDGAGGWQEFTLHGMRPLDPHRPLAHLSYFEADAFARWAGARLPTEAEWESAVTACHAPTLTSILPWHPGPVRGEGALQQLFGACWQWTASSYSPYPGFAPAEGAIGEYNGKFMCNQQVLRGSSCATPPAHARASYRNFFPATARWQFSGLRLAKSD